MKNTLSPRPEKMRLLRIGLACLSMLMVLPALAQSSAPSTTLPEWEQLTPAQRETLIAPMRDRWNNEPETRGRMFSHAERWQSMTPEQRKKAEQGRRQFEHMNSHQREQAKVLYVHMVKMKPEDRQKLRDEWKTMTPEQRKAWMEQNRPEQAERGRGRGHGSGRDD